MIKKEQQKSHGDTILKPVDVNEFCDVTTTTLRGAFVF